ncbi:hypothetical protein [Actinomadura oligospora]|uniref:transmembrane-type terpene cyclase n=1 Tax=Actinomadura oligospora TaxID=111804 RepID=UPI0004B8B243|nr:hypothetical protein [Actinomadura oligospora]
MSESPWFVPLLLASGGFWSLAYVLVAWRNARDRTFGMPLLALVANSSWELLFLGGYPHGLRAGITGMFLLDLVLVAQTLRYGPREFPRLPAWLFAAIVAASYAVAIPLLYALNRALDDPYGIYTTFLANLMTSAMFLAMLDARRDGRGQSMPIAVAKLLGAACLALAFGVNMPSTTAADGRPVLYVLFVAVAALDIAYVIALHRVTRRAAVQVGSGKERVAWH